MGVHGLTSYLVRSEESAPYLRRLIKLRDTKLIIDGDNLCNYLYKENGFDCRCGGQYEEFYKKVLLFFDALKSKGVESFVVLDGAYDRSDKKLETRKERTQERIEKADRLFRNETSADGDEYFLLPLLAKFVFVEVLRDHLIKFAVSDCEADHDIASLAKDWACPVLSDDSDFFIFDVKGGFIPLSSFDVDQSTARIFYRSDVARYFGIREELLPLLASLLGNDYVSREALKPFNHTIRNFSSDGLSGKEVRFSGVKNFLSQLPNSISETQAFEFVLRSIEPSESERERLEKAVEHSLQEYAITKSNLSDYLRNGVVCSLLRTQSNLELDEEVLRRFREGKFSADCVSSLTAGKVFLKVQVEDCERRSSNQCSMALRQLMYGILSDGGRNMKRIEEWDREGFALMNTDIKPYNDKIPSISSILIDPHGRLTMFLDAAYIKSLPKELALVASSLRFLHRNSQPPLENSHLHALLCSCVKLEDGSWKHYLEHPTRAFSQPFDERAAQSFCQWQCVLRDAIHLNFVLLEPVQTPCIRKVFNGKLVHCLQRELTTGSKPESLMSPSSLARYQELCTAITVDQEEKGIDPQSYPHMPEEIRSFIHFFHKHVTDQNLSGIQSIYEKKFNKLTKRYFEKSPWPEPDYVASLVDGDQVFLILYKELYYRHIYNKLKPTLEHHFESYFNYCDLFNYILNTDEPVPLSLPDQWLWDIIDEFIYQFQAFSQYRSKLLKKGKDEVEILRENTKIWNVHSVLNVLYSLVEKSKINLQLERYNQGGDPDSVAGEFGIHPLYKMLGYFSLISLLRLHSLLGDYFQAFKVLENVELNKKSLYSRVPACQITTYYYVGFAYLMMKRYQDAIRSFSNILLYIQRTNDIFQTISYQNEQIMKKKDQMYVLLAICLTLYPQRLDEHVHSQLREKNVDRLQQLQHGNLQTFEESFSYACPKFISPVPPNFDAPPANFNREPFNLQLKVFMNEVLQQSPILVIRSYLKLYPTMPIAKLAAFLDMDESQIRTQLLCSKHKQRNLVWTKGTDALQGELQSSSEVDFYIDQDMIHIADTKVERRYGDFFIKQIHKFEEVTRKIQAFSNT